VGGQWVVGVQWVVVGGWLTGQGGRGCCSVVAKSSASCCRFHPHPGIALTED